MSEIWPLLMWLAEKQGTGEGTLSDACGSIRAAGAILELTTEGLVIKPGRCALAAYMQYRTKYLQPHRLAIVHILKVVAQWSIIPQPDDIEPATGGIVRHYYQHSNGQIISIAEKAEAGKEGGGNGTDV